MPASKKWALLISKGNNLMLSSRITKHNAVTSDGGVKVYLRTYLTTAADGDELLSAIPADLFQKKYPMVPTGQGVI
jgi:hypothetical protein